MPTSKLAVLPYVIFLTMLLSTSTIAQESRPAKETGTKQKTESPAKMKKKTVQLRQQMEIARLELEVSELSVSLRERKAKESVRSAKFAVEMAQQTLSTFVHSEAPVKIKESKISFDQAKNRAELAKDELNELIAMYNADEFAEMTKELVLKRGRRNVEFSQRRLAVQAEKLERLQKVELPKKQHELENKLRQAQAKLADSNLEAKKTAIEIKIMKIKAANKIKNLASDLKEASEKLAKIGANAQ